LVNEVGFARFVILAESPQCTYLLFEPSGTLGFIGNLRRALTEAKKGGIHRYTGQDQEYDLEIKAARNKYEIRDLAQRPDVEVHLDMTAFQKSAFECLKGVFDQMLMLFPEMKSRKDIDELRFMLEIGKQR
jgi:hypothetical protein